MTHARFFIATPGAHPPCPLAGKPAGPPAAPRRFHRFRRAGPRTAGPGLAPGLAHRIPAQPGRHRRNPLAPPRPGPSSARAQRDPGAPPLRAPFPLLGRLAATGAAPGVDQAQDTGRHLVGRRANPETQRLRRPALLGRRPAAGRPAPPAPGGPAKRCAFRAAASAHPGRAGQRRALALATDAHCPRHPGLHPEATRPCLRQTDIPCLAPRAQRGTATRTP